MKNLKGVYLVIDPAMGEALLDKLSQALQGGLGLVQIWNHWSDELDHLQKKSFIREIKQVCEPYGIPVLMNEDWELALDTGLDGVHFDEIPANWETVKSFLANQIIGVTVGNDLERIAWLNEQGLAYLSFCAMFPSPSVQSCEIVTPEVVQNTRERTDLPLFLSGGIRPDNLVQLLHLDFQGVAVISGIMSADDPKQSVKNYNEILERIQI